MAQELVKSRYMPKHSHLGYSSPSMVPALVSGPGITNSAVLDSTPIRGSIFIYYTFTCILFSSYPGSIIFPVHDI